MCASWFKFQKTCCFREDDIIARHSAKKRSHGRDLLACVHNEQHFLAACDFAIYIDMKYLGIDFGLRRIGLAVSEGELVSPWQVLEIKSFSDAVEQISKLIKEEKFEKIIIGVPEGKMAQNTAGFVNALKKQGFEVETAPETLSSKRALQIMIEQGIGQKKRRHEDAYSAAEILQDYLDHK